MRDVIRLLRAIWRVRNRGHWSTRQGATHHFDRPRACLPWRPEGLPCHPASAVLDAVRAAIPTSERGLSSSSTMASRVSASHRKVDLSSGQARHARAFTACSACFTADNSRRWTKSTVATIMSVYCVTCPFSNRRREGYGVLGSVVISECDWADDGVRRRCPQGSVSLPPPSPSASG